MEEENMPPSNAKTVQKQLFSVTSEVNLNTTPQLMDVSIISIPETPEKEAPQNSTLKPESQPEEKEKKDATFSPIVDKSIHDSRPHIDVAASYNPSPLPRNVVHRTSTPLVKKFKADAFSQVFGSKADETLNETQTEASSKINPLERSILKSSRKRSLSVADCDSLVPKKVQFVSPRVMDIGEIDERMLASFREEKETSILKASATRRKRSMSLSDTPLKTKTPKKHVPNFKAIHEAQFKKMDSIVDHKTKLAERAKKFVTPSKSLPIASTSNAATSSKQLHVISETGSNKQQSQISKIPKISRKPLVTSENKQKNPPLRRSQSAEPQFLSQIKAPVFVSSLSRAMSQEVGKPVKSHPKAKVEERFERSKSLYKSNAARSNQADIRKKNENILKGVRLNRRFELMMKNRPGTSGGEEKK